MHRGGTGDAAGGRRPPGPDFDAIVLAGGRGRRLAGPGAAGADKPALLVGEQPLLASVVTAAAGAGARRVVIVGPPRQGLLAGAPEPPGGLVTVREEPAGAGPVPALRRGLAEVTAPAVAVLAADLPFLRAGQLGLLLAAMGTGPGAVLADSGGRPQWLAGCWRTGRLRAAAQAYDGASLHGLLRPLEPALLRYDLRAGEPPPWLDCDTPEDVRRAREWRAGSGQLRPWPEREARQ